MYNLFTRKNSFDDSPFQYGRLPYLRSKVDENYKTYATLRSSFTGRLDSSHLLIKILSNLNVEFTGDLWSYMTACDTAAKRLCGVLGITSSFSKGNLFTESVFYSGCPEIIIYSRSPRYSGMDLWNDWRSVTPIEVLTHPVTELDIVELAVRDAPLVPETGLVIVNIDIPLLAAQWKLWASGRPDGTLENFLTQIPLVGMMRSHLNVALFNKFLVRCGIKPTCKLRWNLPFAQTPTDGHADDLITEAYGKIVSKSMTANQMLSGIPAIYGNNYLDAVPSPMTTPTHQVLWALIAQKMEPASAVLKIGSQAGYDRMLFEIAAIKRMLVVNKEDNLLSSGLSSAASKLLKDRLDRLIVSQLPNIG